MEAFKPTQEPLGAVATGDPGSPEGLAAEEYGQVGPAQPNPGQDAEPPPSREHARVVPPPPPSPAPGLLGRIFGVQ